MWLTWHIKFCTCSNSTPKYILGMCRYMRVHLHSIHWQACIKSYFFFVFVGRNWMDLAHFNDIALISAPGIVFSLRTMVAWYLGCLEIFLISFCLMPDFGDTFSSWILVLSVSGLSSDEYHSTSEIPLESLSLSTRQVKCCLLEYLQTIAQLKCPFSWQSKHLFQ